MDIRPPFAGTVREYTLESYVCDENGQEVFESKATWKYNDDNMLSEVLQYDADDNLISTSTYTYNDNQQLLEVRVKKAEGDIQQILAYEYKDNRLDQITDTASDYRIVTKFDEFGNPIEKQNLLEDGSPFSSTRYVNAYDNNNRLVEKHTIFPSGDSGWVDKYEYNADGLLVGEQLKKHQITSFIKHSYNAKGDLILSEYNPGESNNETLKRDIVYNANNDIVEIKEYRKGWCYQDRGDKFGLTVIVRYSYVR
jgi:YD repeat-containing protein